MNGSLAGYKMTRRISLNASDITDTRSSGGENSLSGLVVSLLYSHGGEVQRKN